MLRPLAIAVVISLTLSLYTVMVKPSLPRSGHLAKVSRPVQSLATLRTPGKSIIPAGTIDGSKTPWLIPDSVAYRLFFVTVAEPAQRMDDQTRRQRSRLAQAKLTDADYQSVVTVLSNFKEAHAALQQKYSEIAAHGGFIDENTLTTERDTLVETTRRELKGRISADGMASLDALVQKEKSRMKIIPNPPMAGN